MPSPFNLNSGSHKKQKTKQTDYNKIKLKITLGNLVT